MEAVSTESMVNKIAKGPADFSLEAAGTGVVGELIEELLEPARLAPGDASNIVGAQASSVDPRTF